MMFAGNLSFPAALLAIGSLALIQGNEDLQAKVQEDEDLLRELATPAPYKAILASAEASVQANIDKMKADARYLRGVLRVWTNIVDENQNHTMLRMASLGLFLGGPDGHVQADGKSAVPGFDERQARTSAGPAKVAWDLASMQLGLWGAEDSIVRSTVKSLLDIVQTRADTEALGEGATITGTVPSTFVDMLSNEDGDLHESVDDLTIEECRAIFVELVLTRGRGDFKVSSKNLKGPAQPMPFRWPLTGSKKSQKVIANEVPESRSEDDGTPKEYPISIGYRADVFRYPTPDERKAKAKSLGLIDAPPVDNAGKVDAPSDEDVDDEDSSDEDSSDEISSDESSD